MKSRANGLASQAKTLFEYGYISDQFEDSRCIKVGASSFLYLEQLCLSQDEDASQVLRLCRYNGYKVLKVVNYVGVLQTPYGEHIEVLPKIARRSLHSNSEEIQEDAETRSRKVLLKMLRHLKQFRHIETAESQVSGCKMPLMEVFIRQFLNSVNVLIKRGLRSDYVRREENQAFLKGKLLVAQQLKHNAIQQHRFYVEYDEYLQDRPINRLIHTAIKLVSGITKLNSHQKLARELMFAFEEVPFSRNIAQDFQSIKMDRGMNYYQAPLAWTRLILEGHSPLSMQGKSNAISLMFPMEAVFEAYVGSILKKQTADGFSVEEQVGSQSLVVHNGNKWFRLKPDFAVVQNKNIKLVMDTKWKLLNESLSDASSKYGLSQADLYQMFAYAHKYLKGKGDLVLIYPRSDKFTSPIEAPFEFGEALRLWVVPFDLDEDELLLPESLSMKFLVKPRIC